MIMKTVSALLGAGMLIAAGTAHADEPIALTNAQMDGVTAGATAIAEGISVTVGDALSETISVSSAIALGSTFASATNTTAGLAASVLGPAASVSVSESGAALP